MLDLVIEETERIDSRFLEPACGTGNFLVEILNRKMEAVHRKHAKNQFEYDLASAQAVSCLTMLKLVKTVCSISILKPIASIRQQDLQRIWNDASDFSYIRTSFVVMH